MSNYYDNIYLHIDSGNVYYYKYDRFNLLYAFNISEGDTIDLVVRCTGFFYDEEESLVGFDSVFTMESVVQEVDSIYLSDRYIKYVTVHFITEHEILENSIYPGSFTYFMKFGHLDDGFIPIAVKAIGPDIDSQRRLRCFTDDEIEYVTEWWAYYDLPCDYEATEALPSAEEYPVKIFPNPAKDQLVIRFSEIPNSKTSVSLYNIAGEAVYSEILRDISHNIHTINLSSLKKGQYIIRIEYGNQIMLEKLSMK